MARSLVIATVLAIAAGACTAAAGAGVAPSYEAPPRVADIAPSGAYAQSAGYAPRSAAVRCWIDAARTRNGVEITPHASGYFRGDYRLVVTKWGRGGSSDIDQGGAINLRGDDERLSSAEIGLERRARYRAVLRLIDEAGDVACADELRG